MKYIIKITLIFSYDFKIDIIVLFDTDANLNCIKEGIVLKWFLQNTSKKLCATNNTKLTIEYKNQESIFNNRLYLKNFFIVTNDINHSIILGTHFIDMITYKINHENIILKINGSKLVFPFLKNPKTRNLNLIKACFIYTHYINALIHKK